jgi:carbamoyltransferase
MPYADRYLEEHLYAARFDALCGGVQEITEELILEWARRAMRRTRIQHLAVSGGVFMNVKASQRLLAMKDVKSLFVMPSAGDESLVFGCCWEGYHEACRARGIDPAPKAISHLYLGKEYDEQYITRMIRRDRLRRRFEITRPDDIEDAVADLLAQGKVVARHAGSSEWGARALGNRSILANPVDEGTIQVLNELIKDRDFWMPFTPSVLPEGAAEYILNPKRMPASYMCITFDSSPAGRVALKAAKHPYDHTIRPQVVDPEWNPSYHRLIARFAARTGIKGILNTSFNLHGEPNVETPEDAIRTVLQSGLEYVAIGPFLFRKVGA